MVKPRVFISYIEEDIKFAKIINNKLEDSGYDPWFDKNQIIPGRDFRISIEKGIRDCHFFLILISESTLNKRGFVQREVRIALDLYQEMIDNDIYIIPVRLEQCEVLESIKTLQWVDLFEYPDSKLNRENIKLSDNGWKKLNQALITGIKEREIKCDIPFSYNDNLEILVEFQDPKENFVFPVTYFRGAPRGSYWHSNDARKTGFSARSPLSPPTVFRLINSISQGTYESPYISLTRSYGIAREYSLVGPSGISTKKSPGYVYEITIDKSNTIDINLVDPIKEIARILPSPYSHDSYQHNGSSEYMNYIVQPYAYEPESYIVQPDGTVSIKPDEPHIFLTTMVRALRDAEISAYRSLHPSLITNRYEVY